MIGAIDALYKRILLAAHPVGSIYQSTVATSPAELFGGSWTAIEGRFLLASGGGYAAGSVGGEETHAITPEEGPIHAHDGLVYAGDLPISLNRGETGYQLTFTTGGASYKDIHTSSAGGGLPHNNMPPYYVVYIWQRTA